jgi:membrane-associated phospholipid phosphatase
MTAGADVLASPRRPWARAALWLAGLGPFFLLSYGLANWLASRHPDVGSVVFSWERGLPFWAWTIVPYWSIDGFYAASLLICASSEELDRHGRRLLTAQVIAVTCFVVWPLRFGFERPEVSGAFGALFDLLVRFDQPFNQAPSLHIALLVILWDIYARRTPATLRWPLHLWFALIGVSVLTTYQHHFIDVPTGALLGFVSLWLWPLAGRTPIGAITRDPRRRSLALRYALGAGGLAAVAAWARDTALWLLWPATSLLFVAGAYAFFGPGVFQKDADGTVSPAARWLLAPYRPRLGSTPVSGPGAVSRSWPWLMASTSAACPPGRRPPVGDTRLLSMSPPS